MDDRHVVISAERFIEYGQQPGVYLDRYHVRVPFGKLGGERAYSGADLKYSVVRLRSALPGDAPRNAFVDEKILPVPLAEGHIVPAHQAFYLIY